jgi:hypothetical protein
VNFPGNAIQQAIYDALSADAGVTALLGAGKIFDSVPQGTAYPYVTIGDDNFDDAGSHSSPGVSAKVVIDTWTQYSGRKQAKAIQDAIYDRLHEGDLAVAGHHFVLCRQEFSTVMKDDDGITHHGVQRFRVITRRV